MAGQTSLGIASKMVGRFVFLRKIGVACQINGGLRKLSVSTMTAKAMKHLPTLPTEKIRIADILRKN